jgi:hypothetical protein
MRSVRSVVSVAPRSLPSPCQWRAVAPVTLSVARDGARHLPLPSFAPRSSERRTAEQRAESAGRGYSAAEEAEAEVMTAMVSPVVTEPPTEIGSSVIVPALWAVISFSIFIASITAISAPS